MSYCKFYPAAGIGAAANRSAGRMFFGSGGAYPEVPGKTPPRPKKHGPHKVAKADSPVAALIKINIILSLKVIKEKKTFISYLIKKHLSLRKNC